MPRIAPILVLLVVGMMANAPSPVSAQDDETDTSPDASQDWAAHWVGSWQDRVGRRKQKIERLLSWQLSETTLATFYGQLNVLYLDYNDGLYPFTSVINNPNSPGRVGVTVETDLNNGIGLHYTLESALRRSNYDSLLNLGDAEEDSSEWNKTLLRKAEVRVAIPTVGFISIGQGDMAGHGITGFDFSNTEVIAKNNVGDTASGTEMYFTNGLPTESALQSFYPIYTASRRFRARYDSPSRAGLSWSTSIGKEVLVEGNPNTYADAALRFETRLNRFRIKGGVAYAYNDTISRLFLGLDGRTG